ncbi:MAG: hypothetical protein ACJ8J0_07880 [Longimicrobiaceae bacterium]
MKKLKLDCEALAVDSFPTTRETCAGAGTVHAREWKPTLPGVCDQTLLGTNPTCCPCTPRY